MNNMKKYFLISGLLTLLLGSVSYSQSAKKATVESFKKQVLGKTFYGDRGLRIKFLNDGTIKGEVKSSKDGTKRLLKGTWKFNKAKGFCRDLTLINPAKGLVKESGNECQSVLHKGKGVIIVNGATWKTR